MKDGAFFIITRMNRLNQTEDTFFRTYELGAQHFLHDCMCAQRRLRSAQSDQSSPAFLCVAMGPKCLPADWEDSDQITRMHKLIIVFAGQSCRKFYAPIRIMICLKFLLE